jgi:ribonucleoside-diphosphate reductase alpha chain
MHLVAETTLGTLATSPSLEATSAAQEVRYAQHKVIRRNGSVVGFEPAKISIAMTKAFLAVNGGQGAASARVREQVEALTAGVVGGGGRPPPPPRTRWSWR